MKRPIVYALLFLTAGIALGTDDLALISAPILLLLCIVFYAKYRYWPVFLFCLFAAAGMLRIRERTMELPLPYNEEVTLEGAVLAAGLTSSGNAKITVRADGGDERLKGTQIILYLSEGQRAAAGQLIRARGTLLALEKERNPGGYNEYLYLKARKTDAKMFPDMWEAGEARKSLGGILGFLQKKFSAVYENVLPEREASIMKSVILGDKTELDGGIQDLYRMAGIYHLLCISGLHISILMLGLNKILSFRLSERTAGLVALVIMVGYCLLTGSSVSTVRAVMMGGVLVFAKVLFKEYDLLASVSFACIVLLLYEPLYLYDAGFQLSFGAVFGIAALSKPVESMLTLMRLPLPFKFRSALAANIAVNAATYPILMFHFYTFTTYSLLVNLIILPTAAVLVVFGLLAGLAGLIWLPAGTFLAGIVYYLLFFYDLTCRFFTGLPLAVLRTGGGGLAVCLCAYGVMAAYGYLFHNYGWKIKKKIVLFLVSAVLLAAGWVTDRYPPGLHITVLDAGWESFTVMRYGGEIFMVGEIEEETDTETLENYLAYLGAAVEDLRLINESNEKNGGYGSLNVQIHPSKPVYYITFENISLCFYNGLPYEPPPPAAVTVWSPGTVYGLDKAAGMFDTRALVVTGYSNRYDPIDLTPLRRRKQPVYSTAEQGAVTIKIINGNINFME